MIKYLIIIYLFFCQSVFSQTNNESPYNFLRLVLNGGASIDETIIYFDDVATDDYDEQFDAIKMLSSNPGVPNIFSIIGDGAYSINVMGKFDKDKVIPLGLSITQNGTYTLSILEKKEFITGTGLYLEDRQENKFYNLNVEEKITLNLISSTILNRFFIHFYLFPSYEVKNETCKLNDGFIIFSNPSSSSWNVRLLKELELIKEYQNVIGDVEFTNLSGGDYIMEIFKDDGDLHSYEIIVGAGLSINSEFFFTKTTYKAGEQIQFVSKQQGLGLYYDWDMGDGKTFYGDSIIDYTYLYPGIYTITLLVGNDECSDVTQKIIKIIPDIITSTPIYNSVITLYPNPVKEVINLKIPQNILVKLDNIDIKDILGKTISKHLLTKEDKYKDSITIQLKDLNSGYYFLNLYGLNYSEVVKFTIIR